MASTNQSCRSCLQAMGRALRPVRGLHQNQSGAISVISVFGLMLLAMLLGMVINVGKQVDDKIRMQNATDAATYSGGVVLARGMNTLSFSNHLLCDVFGLTAYMREARDQMAKKPVPEILAAWTKVGTLFAGTGIPKFDALGRAIGQKVPLEQDMVNTFNEWAAASSELMLPVLEQILADELIPNFQRAIVDSTPQMAQLAMNDIAGEHGSRNSTSVRSQRQYYGVLWRTSVVPVASDADQERRTLPAVDPVLDDLPERPAYRMKSLAQRRNLANNYLNDWNNETLRAFDKEGKMSQFANLWRGFTRGQLERLLDEYPNANLLHMIREHESDFLTNRGLEQDYAFVGVTYASQVTQMLPGLFRHPSPSDAECFAQVMLFIPQPRLIKVYENQNQGNAQDNYGGVPGDIIKFDAQQVVQPPPADDDVEWWVSRERVPTHWDLLNQNWMVQLTPGRADRMVEILQAPPQVAGIPSDQIQPPSFPGLTSSDLHRVNTH